MNLANDTKERDTENYSSENKGIKQGDSQLINHSITHPQSADFHSIHSNTLSPTPSPSFRLHT